MLHAWWAARVPERPALISPSGDRTFGELNANVNRLTRAFRCRGLRPGDAVALMCTQPARVRRGALRGQPGGPPAHPDQLAPDRRRGAATSWRTAKPRRSSCRGGPWAGTRRWRRRPAVPTWCAWRSVRACPGSRPTGTSSRVEDGSRRRRPGLGHPDALHVGHDRAAEGRASRQRTAERPGHGQLLRLRRVVRDERRRPPRHRTPLPRRAARVLGRRPSPLRRAHRGHGALGARRDAPPGRGARHHPHPHGADDVPPAAARCPRTCGRATTTRRCAS